MKRKIQKQIQISQSTNKKGWFNGEKYIPFEDMSNAYLTNTFRRCRKKVLFYHNRMGIFDELSDELELEAERRGLLLTAPDNEFEHNTKLLKK